MSLSSIRWDQWHLTQTIQEAAQSVRGNPLGVPLNSSITGNIV